MNVACKAIWVGLDRQVQLVLLVLLDNQEGLASKEKNDQLDAMGNPARMKIKDHEAYQ